MKNDPKDSDSMKILKVTLDQAKDGSFVGLEVLLRHLTDDNPEIRIKAASYCGRIGFSAAIKDLAEMALKDPVPDNRGEAINALAGIGRPAVIPTLIAALNDQDDARISDARSALYQLLGREVLPLLADEFERDSDEAARIAKWWEERSGDFDNTVVYFMGEPASPGSFIRELKVKRPAIPDALLLALHDWTGEDYGQEPIKEVTSKWEYWWASNKKKYVPGRRYFYGHLVPDS